MNEEHLDWRQDARGGLLTQNARLVYPSYRKKINFFVRFMNDYIDFPPFNFFKRVLTTYPESALLYTELWKIKPKSNCLSINKKKIKSLFLISKTLFRNHLLLFGRLDLAKFTEKGEIFKITFNDKNEN